MIIFQVHLAPSAIFLRFYWKITFVTGTAFYESKQECQSIKVNV